LNVDALAEGLRIYEVAMCGGRASVSHVTFVNVAGDSLMQQISATRKKVENALNSHGSHGSHSDADSHDEIAQLRRETKELRADLNDLRAVVKQLQAQCNSTGATSTHTTTGKAVKAEVSTKKEETDEDIDLFGSDDEEEDEEKERVKQERLKAYADKKAKKPELIAKSSVLLDVKPWDDETDMKKMEECVRTIQRDGLTWGAAKLVPLAYGIKKLQIICVVEDEKISVEDLIEEIQENFADYVQSVDIAAFNKI